MRKPVAHAESLRQVAGFAIEPVVTLAGFGLPRTITPECANIPVFSFLKKFRSSFLSLLLLIFTARLFTSACAKME